MFRRATADILPPILAIIGGGLFELFGLRLTLTQLLFSRLINGSADFFGSLIFNWSRQKIAAYCEKKNWCYKKITPKRLGEIIAFAVTQAPFYAVTLLIVHAPWHKVIVGFATYVAIAPIAGLIYGFILDKSYHLMQVSSVKSNP
ncbi:MAG: L-alanine exporter AlaE [Candidatus Komeilibacteria bacterium]|nr:L-alanine exporter AlaE [Candidatus Komeilibacteria bacterium]